MRFSSNIVTYQFHCAISYVIENRYTNRRVGFSSRVFAFVEFLFDSVLV